LSDLSGERFENRRVGVIAVLGVAAAGIPGATFAMRGFNGDPDEIRARVAVVLHPWRGKQFSGACRGTKMVQHREK